MAGARLIQLSPEAVRDAARETEKNRSGFRTCYLNIYRDVENMRAGAWQGQASESFVRQINTYRNDFELLDNYLGEMAVYLLKVSRDFTALEENLAGEASRLPDLDMDKGR